MKNPKSWIYFFDDDRDDRECLSNWLDATFDQQQYYHYPEANLPEFSTWLDEYREVLPDLLILDLYQEGSSARTYRFVENMRDEPATAFLPVVILTSAAEEKEGPSAFSRLRVDDFVTKSVYLTRPDPQSRLEVRAELSALLQARLRSVMDRSQARRRLTAVRERLHDLLDRRAFAIFDARPPYLLLDGSADALRYLEEYVFLELNDPAPSAMRPLLDGPGKMKLCSDDHDPVPGDDMLPRVNMKLGKTDDRVVIVSTDPNRGQSILVSFRDSLSKTSLDAFGKLVLGKHFGPDYRKTVQSVLEKTEYPEGLSDAGWEDIRRQMVGYYYALGTLSDDQLRLKDIRQVAATLQREVLADIGEKYGQAPSNHLLPCFHRGLNTQSAHIGINTLLLASTMRELLRTHPLVESTM